MDKVIVNSKNSKLMIHATNIHGMGASQVVESLIRSLQKQLENEEVNLYLPWKTNFLFEQSELANIKVNRFKRILPNSISRVSECLLSSWYFDKADKALILGDIPLNRFKNQVVLLHQPSLIDPRINPYSGRNLKYRISRWLFKKNLKFIKYIVVQTGAMKEQIIASYPELNNKVKIISHPAPIRFIETRANGNRKYEASSITLFYPANNYPHKNFKIFEFMDTFIKQMEFELKIIITLNPTELPSSIASLNWLNCVGRLSPEKCFKQYEQVTGLFFPSLLESYGLPLVEAMKAGLPIICSDLPYARWLCEEQAIYFNPLSGESACQGIEELQRRIASTWQVDWKQALAKIPDNWDEVAKKFIDLLN